MDGISGASFLRGQVERELHWLVGRDNVDSSHEGRQAAAADWSWASKFFQLRELEQPGPDFVVRPQHQEHVEKVVQLAYDYGLPIIPRGGGTGTQGGTLAPYGGIALDLTSMNAIIDIDEESLVVTAQAGLNGPDLEKVLNERGLMLAHYPGAYNIGATLGGYVAARGSGVLSTKYGKAEELVMQAKVVVPPGKTIETLPVPLHATGPDLLQLFVGSEGTLGVMTELSFRLDPLPEKREFMAFTFPDVFAGIEAGRQIMLARLRPSVLRLYDDYDSQKLSDWVDTGVTGNLLVVMCDGPAELVDYESRAIKELCLRIGGTDRGGSVAETWWNGRYEPFAPGKLPQPPMIYGTFDTVARFRDIPAIYRAKKEVVESQFKEFGARYSAHFSHWFPWGLMVYDRFYIDDSPADSAEAMRLHDALWDVGVAESLRFGGTVNEHHGIGQKLGRFMRPQLGEAFNTMKAVREAIDPKGLMNPGKLGFGPPLSRPLI